MEPNGTGSGRRIARRAAERGGVASILLVVVVLGIGGGLAAWKLEAIAKADAAAADSPEPMEAVTVAIAEKREHRRVTTAIGTVRALESVTLRNEVPGTVARVSLAPGAVVEPGAVLVALDVSVEEAELAAETARAALAETLLGRLERASRAGATSESEVDRARAELDVARAEIARIRAVIERKTVRAPFRARVGIADVHRGQYLAPGTVLTTLQGVDPTVNVDFAVAQRVAEGLRPGDRVGVATGDGAAPAEATVVAVDARVDPATRNATVRARLEPAGAPPAPGSAVRVTVPVGPARDVVAIPVTALRRGPAGDHVFVVEDDPAGRPRARVRPVRSGETTGDRVLILDGLAAGERVAAAGSFKLRESVLLAIAGTVPADGAGAGATPGTEAADAATPDAGVAR